MKLHISGSRELKKVSKENALYVLRYREFKTKKGHFEILRRFKIQSAYKMYVQFTSEATEEMALARFEELMAKIK